MKTASSLASLISFWAFAIRAFRSSFVMGTTPAVIGVRALIAAGRLPSAGGVVAAGAGDSPPHPAADAADPMAAVSRKRRRSRVMAVTIQEAPSRLPFTHSRIQFADSLIR